MSMVLGGGAGAIPSLSGLGLHIHMWLERASVTVAVIVSAVSVTASTTLRGGHSSDFNKRGFAH